MVAGLIWFKKFRSRAGEMAQWVTYCWVSPRIRVQIPSTTQMSIVIVQTYNPTAGVQGRDRDSWGLLASQ